MEGAINEAYRKTPSWPILFNLRADPFEVSHESALYIRWFADQMWTFVPAQAIAAEFLETFKEFPPVQGSSLSIDNVVKSMTSTPTSR
jgi:arylsulfatase